MSAASRPAADGLARSVRLFRAFTAEQLDQDGYYTLLAADTTAQLERYAPLSGRTVLDVGGGPGYFARAFEARGARCLRLDADAGELAGTGAPQPGAVLGSALDLPVRDGAVDVCFSSNVLEHVPDPWRMASEMVRVTRPGGIVYLAFTNWLSPWGGHETSPWHYLGGHHAARRYERKHGKPPKNLYGTSLHPVSVTAALHWSSHHPDVTVLTATPRYLPSWSRPLVRIPVLREFLTWNLLLVLRRH
ncbi:class I SAM-dependent methyltransferase [Sphaerisporangium aureirubrum]|uniref:Class I SAM-dependent methyltransferase n=1 Tax=Sphaerisporangium aureirubrum TaxID=1544736 RepID=A0ABW1NRX8_9ACTN